MPCPLRGGFCHNAGMPRPKLHSLTFGGSVDELEAAFYEALQQGDLDQLMACWADEDHISCVHPGGPRLIGQAAIRQAFAALFEGGAKLQIGVLDVQRIDALSSAVHSVVERVQVQTERGPASVVIVATNVYHRTAQGWRMMAHHASPGSAQDLPLGEAGSGQLLH